MNDLQALRAHIKSKRQALSPQEQHFAAVHFCQHLLDSQALDQAQHIAVYLAHQGELSLQTCIEKFWQQGKTLSLPHLDQQSLIFKKYTPNSTLHPNQFGILEITKAETIFAEQLDAALVPLVAFDQAGHRIGMGKGYYDRAFAFCKNTTLNKPLLIGCAYDFQEIPLFTPQAHDIPLDLVLTSPSQSESST